MKSPYRYRYFYFLLPSTEAQTRPFVVHVKTDADEVTSDVDALTNESLGSIFDAGGILGFSLDYQQISCT